MLTTQTEVGAMDSVQEAGRTVQPLEAAARPPMRILYLTCFEQLVGSGIFESQVKQYLCKLGREKGEEVRLSQLALRPALVVGRDGVSSPLFAERAWFRALRKEFAQHGVDSDVVFVPVVVRRKWSFYFNLPMLLFVLAFSLPILLYKIARGRYQIIHCRSYVATLCALLVRMVLRDLKVVFDARGFYPEEGLIHRSWTQRSLTYKVWKRLEAFIIRRADYTIALSDTFRGRVTKIGGQNSCCLIYASTELQRFREATLFRKQTRAGLGFEGKVVFAYSGGLGSWHDPVMLAKVCAVISKNVPDARLLILTPHSKEQLEADFLQAGLAAEQFTIMAVAPSEVPRYLTAADFGIVPLRAMNGSDVASVVAETMIGLKVAEYMAAGLPIVVNERVGGLRSLMTSFKIGVFFDGENLEPIVPKVKDMIEEYGLYQESCRRVSEGFLSLDVAVGSYYSVYRKVLDSGRVH